MFRGTRVRLTVDHHGDVHKVDLPACLHAGLAAVHALVGLGDLMDLQVVVCQHLEPAFTAEVKKGRVERRTRTRETERIGNSQIRKFRKQQKGNCRLYSSVAPLSIFTWAHLPDKVHTDKHSCNYSSTLAPIVRTAEASISFHWSQDINNHAS